MNVICFICRFNESDSSCEFRRYWEGRDDNHYGNLYSCVACWDRLHGRGIDYEIISSDKEKLAAIKKIIHLGEEY